MEATMEVNTTDIMDITITMVGSITEDTMAVTAIMDTERGTTDTIKDTAIMVNENLSRIKLI